VLQLLRDRGHPPPSPDASALAAQQYGAADASATSTAVLTLEQLWQETLADSNALNDVNTTTTASAYSSSAAAAAAASASHAAAADEVESRAAADSEEESDNAEVDPAFISNVVTSGPFRATPQQPQVPPTPPTAAAAAAAGAGASGDAVGPALVLEQAVGLACMLAHNADNHFMLVNEGLVPLLVPLLQHGEEACLRR
jgi:hypothetical protein